MYLFFNVVATSCILFICHILSMIIGQLYFADGKDPKKQGYCSSFGFAEGKHISAFWSIIVWNCSDFFFGWLIACVDFCCGWLLKMMGYLFFLFQLWRKCFFQVSITEILAWSCMSWLKWIIVARISFGSVFGSQWYCLLFNLY